MSSRSRSPQSDGINPAYDEQDGYDTSNDRYPPDWTARSTAIRKQDDYTCQDCGIKSGPHTAYGEGVTLDVHHIHFLSDGGSNRQSNLTTLCVDCHNARHDHDITEGRDYDAAPQSDESGSLIGRLVRYSVRAGICFIAHTLALIVLMEYAVGSSFWLAGAGYVLVLFWAVVAYPRQIIGLYGLAGGYWLALSYVFPESLSSASLYSGLVIFWLPAGLAGVWFIRVKHALWTKRGPRANGIFDEWG